MSNIDKQALREAAERAKNSFIPSFRAPTRDVLALLDELEHYKSREERVTKLVLDNSTSWDALYKKLETAEKRTAELERANVAQDDHINQQQDRIEQLEKGHQEAAKQINSWRRLAKQNIAERGKDISELEAARQRIAELEAKLETADRLQDGAFRDGLKAGFSYGQTDDQSGFTQCMSAYNTTPASERERIRREHAEWSDATFGNVGPVGPLKHLSKEALEAAADPSDPLEWADMQFLLWDAQRRAGITDEQIALAMVEKLAVNKKREWPEPKDGEPRLHIKEQSAPVIPDGWISCSERMPEDEQEVIVHNKLGYRYVSYFDEHSGLFFDMRGGNQMNCIEHILVTHWMPLPAAPEPDQS